jgi:hypothetical protein
MSHKKAKRIRKAVRLFNKAVVTPKPLSSSLLYHILKAIR